MVRHVYCMTSDKEMYLDDNECDSNRKPATIATCVKRACPKPSWVVHEWREVNFAYSIMGGSRGGDGVTTP